MLKSTIYGNEIVIDGRPIMKKIIYEMHTVQTDNSDNNKKTRGMGARVTW